MNKLFFFPAVFLFLTACNTTPKEDETEVSQTPVETEKAPQVSNSPQPPAESYRDLALRNKEAGGAFLAETEKKKGVIKTSSGLLYEVIKTGKGKKPTMENQVKAHYHGTHIDGRVFDSSVERSQPIEFYPGQVIQGWQEALQLMQVGALYRFYIPSHLAYGEGGSGPIEPNEVLVFEIELLAIN